MNRWWKRRSADRDPEQEIASHLEMRAEWNRRSGLTPEEAEAAARRQFGNPTRIGEEMRGVHAGMYFESLFQDLRYAVRGFLRNPLFTVTAILAGALGIGACTAVFSVVDRILFRSLPYPHEDRLVSVGMMTPLDSNEFLFPDAYFDLRRSPDTFDAVTAFVAGVAACDLTESNPLRLGCASVEGNFLEALGVAPIVGRSFSREEDVPNGPNVALISFGLWQSRFASDPDIPGKTISIDGRPMTILGVLPPGFELPTLASADLLIPARLNEARERNGRALRVFARLRPGDTIAGARARMQPLFERSLQYIPPAFRKEVHLSLRSLRDRQVQDARLASWVLFGSVIAVLLIACANIANLLLARSMRRGREMAVRAALGAGRGRLVRQTLTETSLLGLSSGALGCLLAAALLKFFIGIAPGGIPRLHEASLDGRVLLFALAGSLASGLLFGLAPAAANPSAESLTGARTTGSRRTFLKESLVAAQIAFSLVLLSGAGLLLRTLWNLENVQLGFQAEHVITAEFTLGKTRYSEDLRQLQFYSELEQHLAQIPGVRSYAITDSLPPSGGARGRPLAALQVEGRPPFAEGTGGMITWRYVTPGYFAALGIPIVRGRGFLERDREPAEYSVILNETLARKLFPGGDAVGQRLKADAWATIVGIAADVRNLGPLRPAEPEYYVLRKTVPDAIFRNQMPPTGWREGKAIVRTSGDAATTREWLRRTFASLDPSLPVTLGSMQARVSRTVERQRFNAVLLAIFAGMGLLLAAIGLYGVMAFLVGQRTQEIGVRMALGATPGAITGLILKRAAVWTAGGAVFGIAGSLAAGRALHSLLFHVGDRDPWTFGVVLAVLLAIALAAAWIPSLRASHVDPVAALRHE